MEARGSREVVDELWARTEVAPSARAERAKRVDIFPFGDGETKTN